MINSTIIISDMIIYYQIFINQIKSHNLLFKNLSIKFIILILIINLFEYFIHIYSFLLLLCYSFDICEGISNDLFILFD